MGSAESFRPWPRQKQLGQSPHFDISGDSNKGGAISKCLRLFVPLNFFFSVN